jgi:hypothetical protein
MDPSDIAPDELLCDVLSVVSCAIDSSIEELALFLLCGTPGLYLGSLLLAF